MSETVRNKKPDTSNRIEKKSELIPGDWLPLALKMLRTKLRSIFNAVAIPEDLHYHARSIGGALSLPHAYANAQKSGN